MNNISLCRSFVVSRVIFKMCSVMSNYEDAVCKLNKLQSNKKTIDQIRKDLKNGIIKCTNIEEMGNFLSRTGVTLDKLDELSVIHIAGTKGKGSTSAMCEAILRSHGFRTGFYSSPHLVAVRERIRLDGSVVSEELFAKHFHCVYDMLDSTQDFEGDMPKYFAFLTVLAFNMFLKEKVDVAIIEVGIGGIVDYTNVLRKVPVVGITALGLDHTSILGYTLPEIAAAKAGIMKPGCEAYTVPQPVDAMQVLRDYADSVKCPLKVVPDYKNYTFPPNNPLKIDLEAYQTNASLAIQLAHAWMRQHRLKKISKSNGLKNGVNTLIIDNNRTVLDKDILDLDNVTVEGLKNCKWPGRYHLVQSDFAWFYLDGAHTKESMEICAQWFEDKNKLQEKILIFSATGDRNAEILLKPLSRLTFKTACFVIPTAYKETSQNNDNFSLVEQEELMDRCRKYSDIWRGLQSGTEIRVFDCVSEALISIKRAYSGKKPAVLVTGSLHLVGAALSIIDPNLST
ncbi:hypothetical protein K1T71_002976 [Dendrolimus kikuchii]|uniref:Uncharacterized protein n=1 Tax=Dendrolimus kikuchii TaxID=765133 RepID=A0ACC1DAR1_9NEOP|nr:hypothetical protein K1T71_002976 [Dendrolimus kikuchii]